MRRALRLALVALLVAISAGLIAPAAGLAPAGVARAATTDLTLVSDATYGVNTGTHRVNVALSIVLRNNTTETTTKKYYFDHVFLAVQPGTTAYKVSGEKGARVRAVKRTADATLLRIDFGSRLYSGASRRYRLTFDILGAGKGANAQTRVGTGLITLPVWAFASVGAHGSSATVRMPAGWTVAVEAGSFAKQTTAADGSTVLQSGALAEPLTWFAFVTGQQPAAYREQDLAVQAGGTTIPLVLRSWTDDAAWAKRIGGLFRDGLPVLRDEIGLDWPHQDPMVVEESTSRSAGGYAGMYDPAASKIEVAYWADSLVALHEAAHGWFNGSLLADRWADEGFASLYAGRTAAALKVKGTAPALTAKVKAAAIPLNAWPAVGQQPAPDRATETYGYAASLALAKAIADRAGDDALRAVWADAAARTGAYQPPAPVGAAGAGEPETVSAAPDWRGLLDLLEARTGKDFSDLWRTWVVRPDEAPLLDTRLEARAAYERTLALAGAWALPREIRDAMRSWQFDQAGQAMADARTVLAQRDAVAQLAGREGLTTSGRMQELFEGGRLFEASTRAEAERGAILAIVQAEAARNSSDDPLRRIGMVGADPERDLAAAKTALAAGDLDASVASSQAAYAAWSGAWQEGRSRLMLALAALATILILVSAAGAALRRVRRGRPGA